MKKEEIETKKKSTRVNQPSSINYSNKKKKQNENPNKEQKSRDGFSLQK